MRPIAVLPLGFACIILIGALLLMLPLSSREGHAMPFLDALFTAASATCVTGLIVVDTGSYFSLFGQAVLLLLIQVGGLGFMTMATILFSLTGRRISLRERMTLAEGFGENRLQGMVRLSRAALCVTGVAEGLGALLLSLRFIPLYGFAKGLWYGLFHSVSAFCNAGFDLIGGYRSFTGFYNDPYTLFILMALIVVGGLGFAVIANAAERRRFRRLRLHSKLVLLGTGALILAGTLLFLLIEHDNPATLGVMAPGEKLLNALFESVTLRTAGFNTIDQCAMRDAGKGLGILLMLVGGAPAGTAGGLKLTTFITLFLAMRSYIRARTDTVAFGRTIPLMQVRRALTIFFAGLAYLVCASLLISIIEQRAPGGAFGLLNQMFETASAFCTVGLTNGLTAAASPATRLILAFSMYIGRVGLLSLAMALTDRDDGGALIRYPAEEILIG
ncbi:MAG: potassium transporter TrkG [Clostridia bacterium]|nr:potassium transporter TrkG [Clostridia bacterium]